LEPEKSICTSPLKKYAAILLTLTILLKTLSKSGHATATRQIIKDGWTDYEGEVVRSEDIQLEQNCPEETVAPSQKEKIVIHEEEAPPESPTTPSSESQDD